MIRVSIDLDYREFGAKMPQVTIIEITNDGTGTTTRSNYNVRALSRTGKCLNSARIENWRRKTSPLSLLSAALQEMGYYKLT